ncbi:MAG: bifunctional DNA primase/polymerase [Pseudomonadota bacterium]
MPDSKNLKAAIWYAKQGFSVIPCRAPYADKEGKDIKIPYIEWKPYQTKKADDQEIRAWYAKFPDARVGIVTGKESNLLVVDADTPEANQIIDNLLPDSLIVPMAKSPHGWHYYFRHELGLANKARYAPGIDVRTEGGYIMAPPSRGLNGKGYDWIKGCEIHKVELSLLPSSLSQFLRDSIIKGGVVGGGFDVNDFNLTSLTSNDNKLLAKGRRDDDLFHLANGLIKGGMSPKEVFAYLIVIATKTCDPPEEEKIVREKVVSAIKRAENREYGITEEVRSWVMTSNGFFLTSECFNGLQMTSRDSKKQATVALLRMVKEGLIEKYGERRGCYRKIDKETEEIKWWEADCEELKIKLPLDLEEYVRVMPQTLTIIAGSQDAGKTALLLNFAWRNCENHKIYYFSSEMDKNELASRLKLLDPYDETALKKIRFQQRSASFADVIEPDAINIIDYFEITDSFFRIAEEFTQIRDKLKKGIAVIALQKDPRKEFGRGASFSMEKPRLYLTVDREKDIGNVLRVKKAKNWRTENNPNGLMRSFWIYQGINLTPKGYWDQE